mmetsp:Transcript_2768/g.8527  ORF Transcript_2768/g.8527 Transcript_2768/m.8527 type:complete len:299 (-) Transcript_2768:648-1544(-)
MHQPVRHALCSRRAPGRLRCAERRTVREPGLRRAACRGAVVGRRRGARSDLCDGARRSAWREAVFGDPHPRRACPDDGDGAAGGVHRHEGCHDSLHRNRAGRAAQPRPRPLARPRLRDGHRRRRLRDRRLAGGPGARPRSHRQAQAQPPRAWRHRADPAAAASLTRPPRRLPLVCWTNLLRSHRQDFVLQLDDARRDGGRSCGAGGPPGGCDRFLSGLQIRRRDLADSAGVFACVFACGGEDAAGRGAGEGCGGAEPQAVAGELAARRRCVARSGWGDCARLLKPFLCHLPGSCLGPS